ncbi:MAG: hypothetical protein ACLQIB_43650 [Isosphaeraceae bacterium]
MNATGGAAGSPALTVPRLPSSNLCVWALACVAGLSAVVPYVVTRWARPDEPVSVSVLYRSPEGDTEVFPLIAALSRGEFGEFSLKEYVGTRMPSHPCGPLAVHAVCFAAFGPYGFAVADVLFTLAYYFCLFGFFRTVRVSAPLAAVLALLASTHHELTIAIAVGDHTYQPVAPLWGDRIPRPFITEVLVVAALIALTRIVTQERAARSLAAWVGLGAALGLVTQSEIYSAMTLLAAFGAVAVYEWWSGNDRVYRNTLAAIATMIVVCTQFILQRLLEHPDLRGRFGLYPVSRLQPFVDLPLLAEAKYPLLVLACAYALFRVFGAEIDRYHGEGWERSLRRLMVSFGLIVVLAYTMMPLSMIVLGKAIQIYHFVGRARVLSLHCTIACFAIGLDFIYRSVAARLAWPATRMTVIGAVPLLALGVAILVERVRTDVASRYVQHLRLDSHAALDRLGKEPYRTEFAGLARHLSEKSMGKRLVIATFDPLVYSWWLTFKGGYSFLAEAAFSTVPDRIVEDRLIALCHWIGMSPDEFAAFVQIWSVHSWWLESAKYQATKAHTFSSFDDYTADDQRRIRRSTIYHTWRTILPKSEVERLRQKFKRVSRTDYDRWELDLIVLTNDGTQAAHAPPADAWRMCFESPRFRVYERYHSAGASPGVGAGLSRPR